MASDGGELIVLSFAEKLDGGVHRCLILVGCAGRNAVGVRDYKHRFFENLADENWRHMLNTTDHRRSSKLLLTSFTESSSEQRTEISRSPASIRLFPTPLPQEFKDVLVGDEDPFAYTCGTEITSLDCTSNSRYRNTQQRCGLLQIINQLELT